MDSKYQTKLFAKILYNCTHTHTHMFTSRHMVEDIEGQGGSIISGEIFGPPLCTHGNSVWINFVVCRVAKETSVSFHEFINRKN